MTTDIQISAPNASDISELVGLAHKTFEGGRDKVLDLLKGLQIDIERSVATVEALTNKGYNPDLWDNELNAPRMPPVETRYVITSDGALCLIGYHLVDFNDLSTLQGTAVFAKFDQFTALMANLEDCAIKKDHDAQTFYSNAIELILDTCKDVINRASEAYTIALPRGIYKSRDGNGILESMSVVSAFAPSVIGMTKYLIDVFEGTQRVFSLRPAFADNMGIILSATKHTGLDPISLHQGISDIATGRGPNGFNRASSEGVFHQLGFRDGDDVGRLLLSVAEFAAGRYYRAQNGYPVVVRANRSGAFLPLSKNYADSIGLASGERVKWFVDQQATSVPVRDVYGSARRQQERFEPRVWEEPSPEAAPASRFRWEDASRRPPKPRTPTAREAEWTDYFKSYREIMRHLKPEARPEAITEQDEQKKALLRSKGRDPEDYDLETMKFAPPLDELAQFGVGSIDEFVDVLNGIIEDRGDKPINKFEYPNNRKRFNALKSRFEFEMQRTADIAARTRGF